jgi:uncharacterized membrane protein YbhN (UPF0104 family)
VTDASGRKRLVRLAQLALVPLVVVGVFVGILPRIADLDQVWSIIASMGWLQVAVLVLVALWNLVTYWPVVVAATPGLSLLQAAVVVQSSTTVAMTVPGGGALAVGVSYRMYTSWGFARGQVATTALVTGIWNIGIKLLLPVAALGLLVLGGDDEPGLVSAAITGAVALVVAAVLLGLALWRAEAARSVGEGTARVVSGVRRLAGKPPVGGWGEAAVRFRSQLLGIIRSRWPYLTIAELSSQLAVFLVFLAAVRFAGSGAHEVGWDEILAVFAFVRLASAIPVLPGNVGLAELGYIGGLVVAGADKPEAVAAVLVFRVLTFYAQIPIGGLTYLVWKRNREWRKPRSGSGAEEPGHPEGLAQDSLTPTATRN